MALAVVPSYAIAVPIFVLCGLGNGIVIVHERLIFQSAVPDRLLARAFATLEALGSWAFGIAYVVAALLLSLLGPRATIGIAAAGATVVWLVSAAAMQRDRRDLPKARLVAEEFVAEEEDQAVAPAVKR
jgi:MFS family permease